MDDPYADIIDQITPPSPRQPAPTASHLPELISFVKEKGLTPGSTTGGRHNAGSKHYSGNAVDIKNSGSFSNEQVAGLKGGAAARGFLVRDERARPKGQKVWGGPHLHLEYAGGSQDPYGDVIDQIAPVQAAGYDAAVDAIAPSVTPPVTKPRITVSTKVDPLFGTGQPLKVPGAGQMVPRQPSLADIKREEEQAATLSQAEDALFVNPEHARNRAAVGQRFQQLKARQAAVQQQYSRYGAQEAKNLPVQSNEQLQRQAEDEIVAQLTAQGKRESERSSAVAGSTESLLNALDTVPELSHTTNIARGAASAVGGTLKQAGNLISTVGAPGDWIWSTVTGQEPISDKLRRAGSQIQAGAEKQGERPGLLERSLGIDPASTVGQVERGVTEGLGHAAIELPKLLVGGQLLGAANLPVQGALSRADEGVPGIIKGAAGGLVYHYGGGAVGKALGGLGPAVASVGNTLVWVAGPAAEAHLVNGVPWSKAIADAIPMGVFAGVTGGMDGAKAYQSKVQVHDGSTVRDATVDDLPQIVNKSLKVAPPEQSVPLDLDKLVLIGEKRPPLEGEGFVDAHGTRRVATHDYQVGEYEILGQPPTPPETINAQRESMPAEQPAGTGILPRSESLRTAAPTAPINEPASVLPKVPGTAETGPTQIGPPTAQAEALLARPALGDNVQANPDGSREWIDATTGQLFYQTAEQARQADDAPMAAPTADAPAAPTTSVQAEPEPAPADGTEKTTGIAERVESSRRSETGQPAPSAGQGISAADSVTRGRELLANGRDPQSVVDAFQKEGAVSADSMALVRARHEELARAANTAFDAGGQVTSDPAFQAAEKARQDWWEQAVKPMQTEWHKTGMAQQGETGIDTGTFYGLYRAFKDATGREPIPTEEAAARTLSNRVATTEADVKAATKTLQDALDKATSRNADLEERLASRSIDRLKRDVARETRTAGRKAVKSTLDDEAATLRNLIALEAKRLGRSIIGKGGGDSSTLHGGLGPLDELTTLVAKLARNRVKANLGIKASELVDQVHGFLKDITDLTPRDVREMVTGWNRTTKPQSDLNQKLSALKTELRQGLRAEDGPKQGPRHTWPARKARLERQIAEYERQVREQDFPAPTKRGKTVDPQMVADLKEAYGSAKYEAAVGALRQRLSQRGPIAPEDTRAIWEHMRKYIDRGENMSSARQKAATDLGLTLEQVTRAITQRPEIKQLTNEMWKKAAARRQARNIAESWVKTADASLPLKALRLARDGMFTIKVGAGLHGGAGVFTHGGENFFHPSRLATQLRFVGKTWRSVVSSGYHEKAMQELESDPNYITAQRAKLANDPHKSYDDYQNPLIQKFFGAGNRGYDMLKVVRQDFFNQRWNRLADSQRTPEHAEAIAQIVNHSTGAISKSLPGGEPVRSLFFAGPLAASRWARIISDPVKAGVIAGKMVAGKRGTGALGLKEATPADRYFMKAQAKSSAEFLGTYAAALALNQAILIATGSKDRVNMTDPSKGDFLRLKVKGRAIEPTGGIITTLDFLGKIGYISVGPQDKRESRGSRMGHAAYQYGRGLLSPIASTTADIATQSDYSERPLPWSSDKEKRGKPRYSWGEYFATQQTPIPVSEAVRDINESLRRQGVNESFIKALKSGKANNALLKGVVVGLVGGTGLRVGQEYQNRKPHPPTMLDRLLKRALVTSSVPGASPSPSPSPYDNIIDQVSPP